MTWAIRRFTATDHASGKTDERWAVGHYAPPLQNHEHPYTFETLDVFKTRNEAVDLVHYLNGGEGKNNE